MLKKLLRKISGLDSPYPWTKWLRLAGLAALMFFLFLVVYNFGGITIWGVIFVGIIFFPIVGIMWLISSIIAIAVGGRESYQRTKVSMNQSEGKPELLTLEKQRLKAQTSRYILNFLRRMIKVSFVCLFLLGGCTVNGSSMAGVGVAFAVIAVMAGFAGSAYLKKYICTFEKEFREKIVEVSLAESGIEDMQFIPEQGLTKEEILQSNLFSAYNVARGSDYLSGVYHGKHFHQSDLQLQEEYQVTHTDEDGHTYTTTRYRDIFRGRMSVFHYDALSNEPVYLFSKSLKSSPSVIETESMDFNQKFTITAETPVTALRILTPQVIEGILCATEKLSNPVSVSFIHDRVFVAIHDLDAFEATLDGDATVMEQQQRISGEITALLAMVDGLYLEE